MNTRDLKPDTAPGQEAAAEKDLSAGEWAALLFLLVGPLVLLGQSVYWLINRAWPALPLSRLLEWLRIPVPAFGDGEWGEKFTMVLGAPTSLVLFGLALVIYLSVFATEKAKEK